MAFSLVWDVEADSKYRDLEERAGKSFENRKKSKKTKSSKVEGLFKQVRKCIKFLKNNPKHPSLQTHEYESLINPYDPNKKVFEAYAQQRLQPHIESFGAMARIVVCRIEQRITEARSLRRKGEAIERCMG